MSDFPLGACCKSFSTGIGATSDGITISSSSSADTKGAWTELDASTESEVCAVIVLVPNLTTIAVRSFLVSIAVGSAGNEEVLIDNLHFTSDQYETTQTNLQFTIPIAIAAGSRITAACATDSTATGGIKVIMHCIVPSFQSPTGYNSCVTYGADAANTNGVVVDPGGSTNTKGAWVELTSSCEELAGVLLTIGANLNTAMTKGYHLFDVGIGGAGNEEVLVENIPAVMSWTENMWVSGAFYPVTIASGTRIAVRSQSTNNNATDRLSSAVLVGVKS